jgi:hypothetical protein
MKNITLFISVFAAVITLSCSKESTPSIVGKWHFYSTGAKGSGTSIVWAANNDTPCEAQSFDQLNADGSVYSENYYNNVTTNACELQDNSQSPYTSTWRREGDDFIWTSIDHRFNPPTQYEYKSRIVSLSAQEMIVQDYSGTVLSDSYTKLIRK